MGDGFCCLSGNFLFCCNSHFSVSNCIWIAITHHSRTIHIFLWAVSIPKRSFDSRNGMLRTYCKTAIGDQPSKPVARLSLPSQVIVAAVIILLLQRLSWRHEGSRHGHRFVEMQPDDLPQSIVGQSCRGEHFERCVTRYADPISEQTTCTQFFLP